MKFASKLTIGALVCLVCGIVLLAFADNRNFSIEAGLFAFYTALLLIIQGLAGLIIATVIWFKRLPSQIQYKRQ